MGVVYSCEEIMERRVPKEGAHEIAARTLLQSVSDICGVELTSVHGSVTDGRATVRSDIDLLVTYAPQLAHEEPEILDEISAVVDAVQEEHFVKIEPNRWPKEPVQAREARMYDRLFACHLADAQMNRKWTIGIPDETIETIARRSMAQVDIESIVVDYLTYKHSGFANAPRRYDDEDPSALKTMQRMLELPKGVGRKLAQAQGILHPEALGDYADAMKTAEIPSNTRSLLSELQALDAEYTRYVNHLVSERWPLDAGDIEDLRFWMDQSYKRAKNLAIRSTTAMTLHFAGEAA